MIKCLVNVTTQNAKPHCGELGRKNWIYFKSGFVTWNHETGQIFVQSFPAFHSDQCVTAELYLWNILLVKVMAVGAHVIRGKSILSHVSSDH